MKWLSCLRIASWLLLMAATLPTGWPRNIDNDWEVCEPKCHCSTSGAFKVANCERAGMNEVPTGLSNQIEKLLLNDNNISKLESKIFSNVGLVNLYTIEMKNCSIEEVDKNAFANLTLINHIDLSDNKIKRLDPVTFQPTIRLSMLIMKNNLIERLENNLFSNLPQLILVDFDSNRISEIGDRAFVNLPQLRSLWFKDNKLVRLQASIFKSAGNQNSLLLDLRENLWRCDCQLRQFFDFIKDTSFSISGSTLCREPEYLRNMTWNTLRSELFICFSDEKTVETNTTSINVTDGNKLEMAQDPENITTVLKPTTNRSRTLDEKLDIIINQTELLRQKIEQLEVKMNQSQSCIRRNNKDAGIVINIE